MKADAATECIAKARTAQSVWRKLSIDSRSAVLCKLRLRIAGRIDDIVRIICEETGKAPLDALAGDVMVTLEQMRYYEQNAKQILQPTPIEKPSLLYHGARFRQLHEPHGVALIYAPYNYPFQLALIPAITALFAGNAVILKCSHRVPRIAVMIADLCADAGLPADLVQVVNDPPEHSLKYVDAQPDIIFVTGSTDTGRLIAQHAAQHLIPCILELGGKDASVVFADCNLDRAVEGVAYGAFSNAGQVCVGIKRLYIEQPIYRIFLGELVDRIRQLRIGTGHDADTGGYGPPSARKRLLVLIADAVRRGATIEWPPAEVSAEGPVILSNVAPDSKLLQEETFGPILCVAPFSTTADAIQQANYSAYALGASVWTGDLARGEAVAAELNAGACSVNDIIRNIANPYAAFGGNGSSGYGRYRGPQGLQSFSRVKTMMVVGDRGKREMHWFPFSARTFSVLKRIVLIRNLSQGWRSGIFRLLFSMMTCFMLAQTAAAQSAAAGHLWIAVSVPQNTHGEVAYLVFASADGFPGSRKLALKSGFVPVAQGRSDVTIDAGTLPAGRYAVSVYQDVNGNHKLDRGFLGIPNEPVGASNNPKSRMGPPRFEECAFSMGASDQKIEISLVH